MMLRVADKAKKKIESNRMGALVIAVVAIGIFVTVAAATTTTSSFPAAIVTNTTIM
jgi:hypothetical protein